MIELLPLKGGVIAPAVIVGEGLVPSRNRRNRVQTIAGTHKGRPSDQAGGRLYVSVITDSMRSWIAVFTGMTGGAVVDLCGENC